ncbi:MAG: NADH:ubiquinone reductase (Na(+)-transporting) subunit B [Planctomycetia bacterium]|nr:NADH:ubiquinone reductase (Na(+)-transporting) subunit B [Planctomycetia bacterium]MDO5112825.1 NADH:ubiquinone reductase (Na(+)-transporting) subunit B [Planctomycetia bacterium]
MLRSLMDKIAPWFEKGKLLHPLYPAYDAIDTFLYTPKQVASGSVHVRDSLCLKRTMTTVMIALLPCVLMAMYNTGYQAFLLMEQSGAKLATALPETCGGWFSFVWQSWFMQQLVTLTEGWGALALTTDPQNWLACFVYGALFFLPIYIVTFVVGILWELLFASVRGHEINEGFFVTSLLFPLTLPATIPLWQVAIAITFGVVVAKELFGGTGRNFLNPALAARAFLFFTFPQQISGDTIWVAVDGVTAATPLGLALTDGMEGIRQLAYQQHLTEMQYWFNSFFGFIPGSMGETSALACLIGAVLLVYTGIASWRIMSSLLVGSMGMAFVFYFMYATGMVTSPVYGVFPHWHFVLGGLAFGMIFMATDPVTGSMTYLGQYIYGFLIGVVILLVRAVNPAYPEGVMLAILLGNVCAPTIDYFVVQANIKRRELRNV